MKQQFIIWLLASVLTTVVITGCSDDKATVATPSASAENKPSDVVSIDSPHDATPEANNDQKQKFQHDFAAQCEERELNNSANQSTDAEKVNKSCECISSYIMKDLTDEEAEKFLKEHEDPQSLRIKFEAAAYECLQEKVKPAEPKIIQGGQ